MLNKLKGFVNKLKEDVKAADFSSPQIFVPAALFVLTPALLFLLGYKMAGNSKNDIRASSVMIVNRTMRHGGTGIILASGSAKSTILTNDHVCRAVKEGGVVRARTGDYQIATMIESELSDLCMITVLADLGVETSLSHSVPQFYDPAIVSGHPALMPNVISTGHFSGRQIISVMTGMRKCTEEELRDPVFGLACAFFGGLPVVRSFESELVTATIMPGSSGSGVYNEKNELSGVVFAGSEGFGYAWIVPYEQVVNFLYKEHQTLEEQTISQELSLVEKDERKNIREILQKCSTATEEIIVRYCSILKRDVTWRQ